MVESSFRRLYTKEWYAHKKKVHAVAWNNNGRRLATGAMEPVPKVWSADSAGVSTSKPQELRGGHTAAIGAIAWDPTHSDRLVTGSNDKTVRIWDTRAATATQKLDVNAEFNVAWRGDASYLAVSNNEDLLCIVDLRKMSQFYSIQFDYHVNEFLWNKTGDLFLVTGGMGTIDVFAFPSMKKIDILTAHADSTYCIDFHPSGKYFAVGGMDAAASLWDAREMMCIRTFPRPEREIRTISFNHNGTLLACGGESPSISILEVESGRCVHEIPRNTSTDKLDWNPKYNLLAYAGDYEIKDRFIPEGHMPPRHTDGFVRVFGFENSPF